MFNMKKYFSFADFVLYLKTYCISACLFGYICLSVILRNATGIDICIPCPIYYATGIRCAGCGLTTATGSLLKLEFVRAWQANPLAYIIDPVLVFLLLWHWKSFADEKSA